MYFEGRVDMFDRKRDVQGSGLCTGKMNLNLTDMEKTTCGLSLRGGLSGRLNAEG